MGRRRKRSNADLFSAAVALVLFIAMLNLGALKVWLHNALYFGLPGLALLGIMVLLVRHFIATKSVKTSALSYDTHKATRCSYKRTTQEHKVRTAASAKPVVVEDVKPTEWSINVIKSLDWKRFEGLCVAYFQATGRKAEITGTGADGGVDIILYRSKSPEKVLGVVQCKAWGSRRVGVKDIRELLGVMTDRQCPLGVFITSSEFTSDAQDFAKGHRIKLLTGFQMLNLITRFSPAVQASILEKITQGDYKTPSCPRCDIKLVLRMTKKGGNKGQQFWGCGNFPQCRYTMQLRSV